MKISEFFDQSFWEYRKAALDVYSFKSAGVGKPCGGSHISASKTCRIEGGGLSEGESEGGDAVAIKGGSPLMNKIDDSLNDKFAPTDHDLKMMKEGFDRSVKNDNQWVMPFKIPEKYDDKSGTPEAVNEVTGLRGSLKQGKDGKITIPDGVNISPKARELINEYNQLDMSKLYTPEGRGTQLNVNGLGVMAGPRDSVPKDSIRGFVQYAALRRQDAKLTNGPNGKIIESYRDPFTGTPRRFYGDKIPKSGNMKGQVVTDILGSQDHWNKPFGIYGLRSENDVRNTVYMPFGMNASKGEMSPTRFAYTTLAKRGVIADQKGLPQDSKAIGGFGARYSKAGPKYDYLPKSSGRSADGVALKQTSSWMMNKANSDVTTKYVPRMNKDLAAGKVKTYDNAAKHVYNVAKQEAERNYFGTYNQPTSQVKSEIADRIKSQGLTPQEAVQTLVDNHS